MDILQYAPLIILGGGGGWELNIKPGSLYAAKIAEFSPSIMTLRIGCMGLELSTLFLGKFNIVQYSNFKEIIMLTRFEIIYVRELVFELSSLGV